MAVTPSDLARTMLERHRQRHRENEARATELRRTLVAIIAEKLQQGSISRAWLIGSLASGRFGEGSDVDLVVEGLEPSSHSRLWDELVVRLGTHVDLLRIEELPASFQQRIRTEGIRLDVP